ncbi:hypothetical protein ACO0SA_001119 [Hanseniaspora valbyensis]
MTKLNVAALQLGTCKEGTDATIEKIISYKDEIILKEIKLCVLPEALLGGYPKGKNFGTWLGYRALQGKKDFASYYKDTVLVSSSNPQINKLENLAKETGCQFVIGCIEKTEENSSLYCTMIFIDSAKGLVGKHRKVMPTGTERLIWAQGDGSTLSTMSFPNGEDTVKIGGAICWENLCPLLRFAMYSKNLNIWCAPTVDQREIWRSVMKTIAYEGRLFVISSCQFVPSATEMGYGADHPDPELAAQGKKILPEWDGEYSDDMPCINGGSVIVNPYGDIIAGPLLGEEGLVSAEVDLDLILESRYDFDPTGHYNRSDIFKLTVNEN